MEHFLIYSLVLCIASFISILLAKTPEDQVALVTESNMLPDNTEPLPSASYYPSLSDWIQPVEELEEDFYGSQSRPLVFDLPDLPKAASDNQNPYI